MHESEHPAQYNGPITRSRATRSRASIHTLPLEVLSTIFILVASDKQILAPIWKDPLPLCAVSSLWRSIALATPQLWQRISVRKSISRATAKSEAKELVLWIKRSELLPLTLVIWYRSFQYLRRSGRGDPIVKVLSRHASRWETLCFCPLDGGTGPFWDPMKLFGVDKWSSLRRIYDVRPRETIPWERLTHLSICRCSLPHAKVVNIFKRCPRLAWLSLTVHVTPGSSNVPASPIILHDLSFASFTTNDFSAVIELISLPALREISVRKTLRPSTDCGSLKALHRFLTRSGCTLDELYIHEATPSCPDDLIQIFAHKSCHFLTTLSIYQYRRLDTELITNEVCRRLTLHHDDSVCTHLKPLTLDCPALLPALLAISNLELVLLLASHQKDYLAYFICESMISFINENWTKSSKRVEWDTK